MATTTNTRGVATARASLESPSASTPRFFRDVRWLRSVFPQVGPTKPSSQMHESPSWSTLRRFAIPSAGALDDILDLAGRAGVAGGAHAGRAEGLVGAGAAVQAETAVGTPFSFDGDVAAVTHPLPGAVATAGA